MNDTSQKFEIVIPTKNRPDKLGRTLAAIDAAREAGPDLPVLICDSSDDERHREVQELARRHPRVRVQRHDGDNIPAARNVCVAAAEAEVLINVDDDITIHTDALREMVAAYEAAPKPAVVGGSVSWDGLYCRPIVMRWIGYGRSAEDGQAPNFLITALFAFPRDLAEAVPWNTRIDRSDDRFITAAWRGYGVHLGFAPAARADHDPDQNVGSYGAEAQLSHVYANLFDAIYVERSWSRALAYEFLGFAAGAKLYFRRASTAVIYTRAWARGNWYFFRDRRYLRDLMRRELPDSVAPGR